MIWGLAEMTVFSLVPRSLSLSLSLSLTVAHSAINSTPITSLVLI